MLSLLNHMNLNGVSTKCYPDCPWVAGVGPGGSPRSPGHTSAGGPPSPPPAPGAERIGLDAVRSLSVQKFAVLRRLLRLQPEKKTASSSSDMIEELASTLRDDLAHLDRSCFTLKTFKLLTLKFSTHWYEQRRVLDPRQTDRQNDRSGLTRCGGGQSWTLWQTRILPSRGCWKLLRSVPAARCGRGTAGRTWRTRACTDPSRSAGCPGRQTSVGRPGRRKNFILELEVYTEHISKTVSNEE